MNNLEDLAKTYGPAAPFSEHERGDVIAYTTADGLRSSRTIVWVEAATPDIPMKYVVAPDAPGGFLDFVVPGDVLTQDERQEITTTCQGMIPDEPILHACPYWRPFQTGCWRVAYSLV